MEQFSSDLKEAVQNLLKTPAVQSAMQQVEKNLPETIEIQKELALIEAPTGFEEKKALRYMELLKAAGLEDVAIDEHFNVYGRIKGSGNTGKGILLEGHLDTVFAFGSAKEVIEDEEGKLHCPGICDDTRALAANLAVLKALKANNLVPVHDIYIAGTVCEEGLGGMQGMDWTLEVLSKKTEVLATVSIDGATAEIFYANATGMVDWDICYEGPGGHAWTAHEAPSAVHAAALAVAEIAKIRLPKDPKTTITVSLIEGGQAIHGIAQKASFKINARSNSAEEMEKLNQQILEAAKKGEEIENSKPDAKGKVFMTAAKILDIPAGTQEDDARIIQLAKLVTQAVGKTYRFEPGGCTNTNMSIGRGIPAVTFGRGGREYGTHTLDEWFDPKGVFACEQKSILMLAALAGITGVQAPLGETLKN